MRGKRVGADLAATMRTELGCGDERQNPFSRGGTRFSSAPQVENKARITGNLTAEPRRRHRRTSQMALDRQQ
jgi:hypothetical protein